MNARIALGVLAAALLALPATAGAAPSPANTCYVPANAIGVAWWLGTPGADTLIGSDRSEPLCGRGGNDFIDARGGDDEARGGAGNDVVYGRGGNDRLAAGPGADSLFGGAGDDVLVATARDGARDAIDCGAGRDTAHVSAESRTPSGDIVVGCERIVLHDASGAIVRITYVNTSAGAPFPSGPGAPFADA